MAPASRPRHVLSLIAARSPARADASDHHLATCGHLQVRRGQWELVDSYLFDQRHVHHADTPFSESLFEQSVSRSAIRGLEIASASSRVGALKSVEFAVETDVQ